MGFAIRYDGRDFPVASGRFVIGRSEDCQLRLDDPMASRNHAAIELEDASLRIEDLNSRNGVFVNEQRLDDKCRLKGGDQIRIGSQILVVLNRTGKARAETLVNRPVTTAMQAFGVLGGLADKALSMGRGDEVERILGRQLEMVLERTIEGQALSEEEFEKSVRYAYGIARLEKDAKWVGYLFRVYGVRVRLMDGELVNELYALAPRLKGSARAALRDYLEVLREASLNFAPGERFVMKRLEGLEQALP